KNKPPKDKENDVMTQETVHTPVRKTVGTKELAEALDCDPRTIVKAAKAGKIPAFRIDKEFRFDPAAVRIALSNNARSKR
ncbi:MAG: helix-turn-helix domain-containing protein, partial [Planctomycetota bacterium]